MSAADTTIIEQRIKDLDERIYALECSDDMLFSNANGNLPRWEAMVAERNELLARKEKANDNSGV